MAAGAMQCLVQPCNFSGGHAVDAETLGELEGLPATESGAMLSCIWWELFNVAVHDGFIACLESSRSA